MVSTDLAHAPLSRQIAALDEAITASPLATAVIEFAASAKLPNWYLGAGAVTQTVWNVLHDYEPAHGIKDYDVVYFDPTQDADATIEAAGAEVGSRLGITLDLTNQAYVHTWYAQKFGRAIAPYRSTEHAISTWPTTASCVGIRRDRAGRSQICAPYGLADLWGLVVRPNKTIVSREVYEEKATRWLGIWPDLQVHSW
jgi:hypothetical protein